jgi:hypothetical protein
MNIHRSVYPVTDPLAGLTPSQRAQLTLLCWVAGVDGDVAAEERSLLGKLSARLLPQVDPEDALAALQAEETLDLEAQVQEAEWAARQVLKETPALIDRLNQLLFGWGAWPSIEALEASGTSWL